MPYCSEALRSSAGSLWVKNQLNRTRSVFTIDILLVTVIGLFLSITCFLFPGIISLMLGAKEGLGLKLSDYVRGYAFGFIPIMLFAQFSQFLQMERQEKRTYAGIGVMLVANTFFDWLFVVVFKWEMMGLGLATTLSNWIFLLMLGTFYFSKKAVIRFDLSSMVASDANEIFRIGFPGALSQACQMIRGLYQNYIILRFAGEDGMSAFAAVSTFGGLFFATIAGVSASTRILISIYSGEEDRTGLITIMKTALTKGLAIATLSNVLFVVLASPITHIFYQDTTSEVYRLALWGFRLFPISMPLACINLIFCACYQCTGRMGIVNFLSILDGLIGTVITSAILLPMMGGMGIWATQVVNGIYALIVIFVFAWIMLIKFPKSIENLMVLPESFGVSESDRIDISIRSVEEVVNLSERIIEFCKGHGMDEKRAFYAGLCVEEMAGNVVEYGFSDGTSHSLDIRAVHKESGILIRMRDDCKGFNPKERTELFDPEDITKNIGLRMVGKIASGMEYQNMLGLNVLTITI